MSEAPPVPQGPRAGCIFFALPILLTISVVLAYLLILTLGSVVGASNGPREQWTVTTCDEGKSILEHRITAIGLGEPEWAQQGGHWTLTVTLPGRDAAVDARIPSVLAQPGRLGVFAGTTPNPAAQIITPDHIASTSFTLREMANPLIEARLTNEGLKTLRQHMEQHPEGTISIWLDDTKILERQNTPIVEGTLLELRNHDADRKHAIAVTAEWAIALGHGMLPCPTTVQRPTPTNGDVP